MFVRKLQQQRVSSQQQQTSCKFSTGPISTQSTINSFTNIKENRQNKLNKMDSSESLAEIVNDQITKKMQDQIFVWFQNKNIKLGNPSDIVHQFNQNKKKLLYLQPEWNKVRKMSDFNINDKLSSSNNLLLSRRRQRSNTQCY